MAGGDTPAGDIEGRRAALRARFPVWQPATLGDFLASCAAEYGERPFVLTDDRTVSYAEADSWATRLADGLAALGIRPGDRVGVLMANYLEFVPVKFAIARAGAVAIPFNYLYRTAELGYVLAQSQCHALVTMTGFAGLDYLAMLDEIAPGWERGPTAALPDLRAVVLLDTGGPGLRAGVLDVPGLAALGEAHAGASGASGASGAAGAAGAPGAGMGVGAGVTPDSPGDIL